MIFRKFKEIKVSLGPYALTILRWIPTIAQFNMQLITSNNYLYNQDLYASPQTAQ